MQTVANLTPTKKIGKAKRGRKPKKSIQTSESTIDDFEVKTSDQIETEETNLSLQVYKGVKIPKYLRHPEEYQFLEVPVIVPTIQELQQPFLLVRRLHKEGYMKHGVVKIRPDKKTWNPEFVFDTHKKLMTTRIQCINDLTKGKAFEQNVDEYTYESFKKQSDEFDETYKYQTNLDLQNQYRKNEYEYFSTLDNPDRFKDIEIEYAADLPSSKFGSAFAEQKKLGQNEQAWSLKNINKQHNSLFQFVENNKNKCELSGITSPWVYLGMKFASFCFHTEDLWMYALNYMHSGEAKTWYTVPPQFKEKFEEVYKAKYHNIFQQKPDILYRLNLQLNPAEALKAYVPMYRTEQQPGEFMMTFPKVYHGGFSHGFNCGEAVNIATAEWFKFYREAVEDYALKGHLKKVSFPLEWMLTQVIDDLHQSYFDVEELQKIRDEWTNVVKREIQQRLVVLQTYEDKLIIHEFDNKKVKYDRMVCKNCESYMFFSYLYCNKCLKSSCISHVSTCFCINSKVSLFVRYTDNELHAFTNIIDEYIKKLQKKSLKYYYQQKKTNQLNILISKIYIFINMGDSKKNTILLSSGSIISFLCLAPNTITALSGVALTLALTGVAYFISQGWVSSQTNEWLLIIENGLLKKAGVGLKTFKWYTQTAVTFPSTIQGVNFKANQVTKENFGIEIEGIVFWAVNRDADGPFKCYKYTQGSDANENVQQVTESIVRTFISNTTLMDVLRKRVQLREQITKALQKQLFGWGIWPETVEITEVKISSNTLFKDMQTEFRFKHKQLAKNAKQQSKQILEEEQSKYSLEMNRVLNQKETELEKFRLEQEIMRNNFISQFEEKSREIQKQNMLLDKELQMIQQERSNNYSLLSAKNEMEINKINHEFEQKEKKDWEAIYDKMNEKNMEKLEIDKTAEAYASSYDLEGFYVNKYIGPENLQQVSSFMPVVNMVNQMTKQ